MDITDKRFIITSEQSHGLAGVAYFVVVDTITGVNYLQTYYNSGTSLTPLLNSMGEVVISSKKEIEELKENFI